MSAMLDYMQLCRLCLVKDKADVPIFGDENDVRQIFLKITACLPVKVSQEDNLPKKICDSCLYKVDLLYQFWNTTVNAEKQLVQWLTEIGVDVNIKNADTQPLPILPQSHAHPHSMPETLLLKQEHPELIDQQQQQQQQTYPLQGQQTSMYPNYDTLGYPQPEVAMDVPGSTTFVPAATTKVEPETLQPVAPTPKKRGRPAGTTNKKTVQKKKASPPPPVTVSPRTGTNRRSSATAAAAAVAAAAAAASDSDEDSDNDHLGGDDDDDESFNEDDPMTKEEADSESDYVEPTAFVGVPSTSAQDEEQPGPSGLGGTNSKGGTTESGFDVKLPEGIRIKKSTTENQIKVIKVKTTVSNSKSMKEPVSIYDEVMDKIQILTSIKPVKEIIPEPDTSSIVNNLLKSGLTVKKIIEPIEERRGEEDEPILYNNNNNNDDVNDDDDDDDNNNDDDDDDSSEYEVEALEDEDSSDLEYLPTSVKKKSPLKGQNKESRIPAATSVTTSKPKTKNKEFIKIQSTNYLCIMCNEKFPSFDMLTKHMTSAVPCRVVSVACPICGKEFPSRSRCSSHISSTHKERPKYHCTKCSKFFSNPVTLQIHEELNHTEYFDATDNGFKCKMCDKEAENRRLILHHINQKHLHVSTLLCDICGKSFLNENGLRNHIQTHRETKSYLCQICSKAFKMKSSLRAHIKTHDTERSFICDECGKSFKKKCSLSEHKKYHAGDFSFPCNWCTKKFVSKSLLNTHMKNHAA